MKGHGILYKKIKLYFLNVIFIYMSNFMSHTLLWRHIILLTVGVYSSNHGVLYTIEISMTRGFRKSVGPSVCLSVRRFVTLAKKPSLLTVE